MITTGRSWMRYLRAWVSGQKHPNTPRQVFVNCYEYDRVRRALPSRCRICGYVVSRDAEKVREVNFKCDDSTCCDDRIAFRAHQVCNLCYDMFHSLYINFSLVDRDYFKKIDEKIKTDYDNFKRRDNNKGW